jgi:hypothetical protein
MVDPERVILYVIAVNAESVRYAGCQTSWKDDVATWRIGEVCVSLTMKASVVGVAMKKDTYAPGIHLVRFGAIAG